MENANISVEEPEVIQSPTNDQQYEVAEESNNTNAVTTDEVPEPPAPVQNGPLQEPSFNFLQESQIDMGAPHMDPAAVAVRQIAPLQAVNFTMNPYPPYPPHEEVSLLSVNGNEPHETLVLLYLLARSLQYLMLFLELCLPSWRLFSTILIHLIPSPLRHS
ncbi:hypothetical protein AVEN_16305-1 [Araneus ventricosus]|uniref:Uncharacterized protein n=1 Tax=Araneus ventricosus TaxID=182803 RepID=A0A4Y2LJW7_ARAVE|nr:hypothetical protein AVEN_16305-1 [Araneus ventricosus]